MADVQLSPTGTRVCVDTPLRLRFDHPVRLGSTGRLEVRNEDGTLAAHVDLADPRVGRRTIGGARSDHGELHLWHYHPVLVDGGEVTVVLPVTLEPEQHYTVTVDPGFVIGHRGVAAEDAWSFRTGTLPARDVTTLTVDATGAGDFCTVQGAVDHVPEQNQRHVLVQIAAGTYTEIVYVPQTKGNLTLRGAGRRRTVIGYANNDVLNGDAAMRGEPIESSCCPKRAIPSSDRFNCWRAVLGIDADDVTVEQLTIQNTTPAGGGQAEALRGNGERIRVRDTRLLSRQDTVRLQGSCYLADSYVEGDVDFVWGSGALFVERTELKAVGPGYYTQLRNADGGPGAVFVDVRLTRAAEVPDGASWLSRVELSRFGGSQVVFIDAAMDAHIAPAGWLATDRSEQWDTSRLQLAEHGSTTLDGQPLDLSGRDPMARPLTADEAAQLRDPRRLLGGWDPR
ncbi:MAG TPA: pectinesterase family protein [Ruania sp.]|nr:pectinesterase family protein [Ruania sp.]